MPFASIMQQYQTQQAAARRANELRYRQGLKILRAGYTKAGRYARQFGKTAMRDIEESAVQQRATGEQDLISRGLGGTTIRGAMTRGVERERLRGRARIGEQRSMLLGQVAQQRAQDVAGFIERRTDVGPDLSMFASLLQAAGQGQPLAGGAGGAGGYDRGGRTPRRTVMQMGAFPRGDIFARLGWRGEGGAAGAGAIAQAGTTIRGRPGASREAEKLIVDPRPSLKVRDTSYDWLRKYLPPQSYEGKI